MEYNKVNSKYIKDVNELKEQLPLQKEEVRMLESITHKFPMLIPNYYFSLIDKENYINDPIAKMCLPSLHEDSLGGRFDTSGESINTVMVGLQHKYQSTALILSTNKCAMYCRHCFRKRMVGLTEKEENIDIDKITEYIVDHKMINNVLISGGDALMLSNRTLRYYLECLTPLENLDFIRIATRIPVVYPRRLTDDLELLDILQTYNTKKRIYVVTQFNHPNEITYESVCAINTLINMGIIVRNQTVLLRDVNADINVLSTLLRKLTQIGVVPYYIFQCRPVCGVKNQFQIPLMEGYDIVQGAKELQNGIGKGIRFCMSHTTGKIEIIGKLSDDDMIFKYHQAKNKEDNGRIFVKKLSQSQTWID